VRAAAQAAVGPVLVQQLAARRLVARAQAVVLVGVAAEPVVVAASKAPIAERGW
jgi:hypothetical protein